MISIITPVYNNPETLEKFLKSVYENVKNRTSFETIVVDDFSAVDIKPVVDRFNGARYIRLDRHGGPAKARNTGGRNANGEYLIFFDSDVVVRPDTLSRFEEHFRSGVSAVVGEYDIEPAEDGFFPRFKSLLTESWIPNSRFVSIFVLRAAGIRKDIFEKVGGFDEEIKTASVEDYEFADKLAKAGVKIVYDPRILVRHHHPGFIKQMKLFYLRSRDWVSIFIKRGGRFDNMCATPLEGLGSLAGTVSLASLVLILMFKNRAFLLLAAAAFIAYVLFNLKFLCVVRKRRGMLFIPVALFVKLPLAVMVTSGFVAGVFRHISEIIKVS